MNRTYSYTECDKCNRMGSRKHPLITVCEGCHSKMHRKCFFSMMQSDSMCSDTAENQITIEKLLMCFSGQKNRNEVIGSDKHRYFRSRLEWPKYSFKTWLVLSFFKPNRRVYTRCSYCMVDLCYYGYKNPFHTINNIFNCLKLGSFALAVISFGTIFTASCFETCGIYLSIFMKWIDKYSVITIGTSMFTPHFLYCLVSPTVSLRNLLISSLYAQFGLGIGYTIPRTLKTFIKAKFALKLLDCLTLNLYYFTSFKTINPVLFGTKLSIEDAAAILDHQLYANEDFITPNDKIHKFLQDLKMCLKEDFAFFFGNELYQSWKNHFGGLIILATGQLLSFLNFYNNPFYSDTQNAATRAVIVFAVLQLLDYTYTNWNAIALTKCYKRFVPADDTYRLWTLPVMQYLLKVI